MKAICYSGLFLFFLAPAYYAQKPGSVMQKQPAHIHKPLPFEAGEPDAAMKKHLMELSAKYPPGMNRDSSEEKNCKVQRWILVENKETCATEFQKKTYAWGATYYFENSVAISKERFLQRTKQ